MSQGWIKLYRDITSHWLFEEERTFSKFEAWTDLMLMVNHQDKKIMVDGELVTVERGSTITSVRTLCQRWKWSNTKTVKFLEILENDGMLIKKSDTKKTVITLVNYGKFQGDESEKATQERHSDDVETTLERTNKNVKNGKNEKKKIDKVYYAEFVTLTEDEFLKLNNEYGEDFTQEAINVLNSYKGANGKKYKSDYLAMLNWVVKRVQEESEKVRPFVPRGGKANDEYQGRNEGVRSGGNQTQGTSSAGSSRELTEAANRKLERQRASGELKNYDINDINALPF